MSREVLVFVLSVSLIVSCASVVHADSGPSRGSGWDWQVIQYFGTEEFTDLEVYWQWFIATGVGAGCGFIGLGVGTLNPFVGFLTSTGCEAALMA